MRLNIKKQLFKYVLQLTLKRGTNRRDEYILNLDIAANAITNKLWEANIVVLVKSVSQRSIITVLGWDNVLAKRTSATFTYTCGSNCYFWYNWVTLPWE